MSQQEPTALAPKGGHDTKPEADLVEESVVTKPGVQKIENAINKEHSVSLRDTARKTPKIIWWSFFWCMCAVGCKFSFLA